MCIERSTRNPVDSHFKTRTTPVSRQILVRCHFNRARRGVDILCPSFGTQNAGINSRFARPARLSAAVSSGGVILTVLDGVSFELLRVCLVSPNVWHSISVTNRCVAKQRRMASPKRQKKKQKVCIIVSLGQLDENVEEADKLSVYSDDSFQEEEEPVPLPKVIRPIEPNRSCMPSLS